MSEMFYLEKDSYRVLTSARNEFSDLCFCYCGIEKCAPSYAYGPDVRYEYLIHLILDGQGTYYVNDKMYNLKKNQGFLILPNEITYYKADKNNPWTYIWLGFNGTKAKELLEEFTLTKDRLVFEYPNSNELKTIIDNMLNSNGTSYYNQLMLQSETYKFLAKLSGINKPKNAVDSTETPNIYIDAAIKFIETNYASDIKVYDIANHLGLNRCYFTCLFKQSLNMSPQEFLLNFRLNRACDLLKTTELPISDISKSVGYYDPLSFSKTFKKVKEISPKAYRIANLSNLVTSNTVI